MQLDVARFRAGIYFVKLLSSDGKETVAKKFVKESK